jgi:hypothetical protein
LKGYVTNLPAAVMPATEVIAKHHDLWNVEKSFRMSKSDLAARPMFHRTRDAIEAHLTIVFTALAVAHCIQERSRASNCQRHQTAALSDHHHQRRDPDLPHPTSPNPQRKILTALASKWLTKSNVLSQQPGDPQIQGASAGVKSAPPVEDGVQWVLSGSIPS